ncbi:Putative PD-(D/E)XK family member [Clostridium amylolyticum]|uniref:Putative PD-(D/E)XK family member n=2 Tax=Clostridium amylolyticum TaxID=1121298 RepID=A0A1M6LRV5_9CLOT|nr:Putative PD-(D/E)XK family member [Clostridium amylolyticum]
MLSNKELLEKWNSIPFYGGGFKRIDDTHPLEWYIGYEDINQKTLLLVTNFKPSNIASSKSIIASTGQRIDGKWALSLRLIKKHNEDVFIRLCWDIIEFSRDKFFGQESIDYIVERYSQWLKLMEYERPDLMDELNRKGLLGEMLYLEKRIQNGMDVQVAVEGWIGPDGADQDFVYADGWVEVKCTGPSSNAISISSAEQLDAELPGFLCVYFLDKTTLENSYGFTLMEKVEQLRCMLASNKKAKEVFENKIFKYGYSDRQEYNDQKYRCNGVNNYKIDSNFPRLIKNNIPPEVEAVKYSISLSAIENWKFN